MKLENNNLNPNNVKAWIDVGFVQNKKEPHMFYHQLDPDKIEVDFSAASREGAIKLYVNEICKITMDDFLNSILVGHKRMTQMNRYQSWGGFIEEIFAYFDEKGDSSSTVFNEETACEMYNSYQNETPKRRKKCIDMLFDIITTR